MSTSFFSHVSELISLFLSCHDRKWFPYSFPKNSSFLFYQTVKISRTLLDWFQILREEWFAQCGSEPTPEQWNIIRVWVTLYYQRKPNSNHVDNDGFWGVGSVNLKRKKTKWEAASIYLTFKKNKKIFRKHWFRQKPK